MTNVLVTGGTGYIGSHVWVALERAGFNVVGLDNLSNSDKSVISGIAALTGTKPRFVYGDVRDENSLREAFAVCPIDVVVHFAASKAVGESCREPLHYYDNNVGGLVHLCRSMVRHGVERLVFSSSATVYGEPVFLPYTEEHPLHPTSPYGRTKLICEQVLDDQCKAVRSWRVVKLRYFNPVGAHPSALIGEVPRGEPGNLMPYVQQVAAGQRPHLSIFGTDYPTKDGTGVRDYVHVVDLAEGHVAAVRRLASAGASLTVNLGTGRGSSVREVVETFERVSGRPIRVREVARRPGDVACYFADATLAATELGWSAQRSLEDMCRDSWRWQSRLAT